MSSRDRSRTRRRFGRIIFVALVGATLLRWQGPTLIRVGDDSVAPTLVSGDLAVATRVRSMPQRGALVIARSDYDPPGFFSRHELVLRVVAALPGDRVSWSGSHVTVRHDSGVARYRPAPLHPALAGPTRQAIVPTERLFLLSIAPGRRDSRVTGFAGIDTVRYTVRAVLWPGERRARVTPLTGYRP